MALFFSFLCALWDICFSYGMGASFIHCFKNIIENAAIDSEMESFTRKSKIKTTQQYRSRVGYDWKNSAIEEICFTFTQLCSKQFQKLMTLDLKVNIALSQIF